MAIQTIKQNLVYIGIALLVYFALSAVRPVHPFQPTGIILPMTKTALTPAMSDLQFFEAMPTNAKPLAYINLEAHSLNPNKRQENQMMNKAAALARQAGADGLVVTAFGYEGVGVGNPAPLAKYVLFGTAVKLH